MILEQKSSSLTGNHFGRGSPSVFAIPRVGRRAHTASSARSFEAATREKQLGRYPLKTGSAAVADPDLNLAPTSLSVPSPSAASYSLHPRPRPYPRCWSLNPDSNQSPNRSISQRHTPFRSLRHSRWAKLKRHQKCSNACVTIDRIAFWHLLHVELQQIVHKT